MNLELINKFEKEIGKPIRYISAEYFLDIFNKKELGKKYFNSTKNALDILEVMKTNVSLKEMSTILEIKIRLRKTEESIDDIFSRYTQDNNRETLIDSMGNMIKSDDDLTVVSSVLCTMIALEDQELEGYRKHIENALNGVFKIISNITITKDSYSLHCDILDLLIKVLYYWNSRYEELELEGLDKHLEDLHNFEFEVFDNGKYASVDIKPEALNLLDITKLKK